MSDFNEINRRHIASYFQQGCKQDKNLGFELEHTLVHRSSFKPASYAGRKGVSRVLERLSPHFQKVVCDGTDILGLCDVTSEISLEPAAQLELSAGPYTHISEIEQAYKDFRSLLDPILDDLGLEALLVGYNPSAKASKLKLIPKFRYECMTRFLQEQSDDGVRMMRGTASLQVSIDYRSEADAMRKLRLAQKLAPVLSLMTDNALVFEGKPRTHKLVRTGVWAGMKQDRVGIIPGSFAADFSFLDYADYILSREAILIPDATQKQQWRYVGHQTFSELYAHSEMNHDEIEHALSMVWPDARLKNFVEIRPADAMPLAYSLAFIALVQALFYHDESLDTLDKLLTHISEQDTAQAKLALMKEGYQASLYGEDAGFWADKLVALALRFSPAKERDYLAPLVELVGARCSLADRRELIYN